MPLAEEATTAPALSETAPATPGPFAMRPSADRKTCGLGMGPASTVPLVIIRQATERDWPLIYPIYAAIMAEGKTYAFPEGQSLGFRIIGTAPASFDHPEHGLVGLHIMFRHL